MAYDVYYMRTVSTYNVSNDVAHKHFNSSENIGVYIETLLLSCGMKFIIAIEIQSPPSTSLRYQVRSNTISITIACCTDKITNWHTPQSIMISSFTKSETKTPNSMSLEV